MAEPFKPVKVKLFAGIIFSDTHILQKSLKLLTKKYGPVDYITKFIPFRHTEYYKEIGVNRFKVLLSFKKLVFREKIPKIKLHTNGIEKSCCNGNSRKVNIDPGYMTLSNVFLASCKDYYHRIYISNGVYIENELRFTKKNYIPFEWTYPDYKQESYIVFFKHVRKIYNDQLKTW